MEHETGLEPDTRANENHEASDTLPRSRQLPSSSIRTLGDRDDELGIDPGPSTGVTQSPDLPPFFALVYFARSALDARA